MQSSANNSHQPLRVVQFTDTHFFEAPTGRLMGVDTAATFGEVKALAQQQRGTPDFYLLTGDLSQDETEGSYRRFSEALEDLQAPAFYLPGNHDRRAAMHKAFSESKAPIKRDRVFPLSNWVVVLLDTLVENEVHGHLEEAELTHLQDSLSQHKDKHALVCMHHHPLPMGAQWLDEIGVDNADRFLEIIDSHSNVRCVLWGHVHQQFDAERNGIRYLATPSTCVQFKPLSESFAADEVPPGYRWLELTADGKVHSAVERLARVAAGLDMSSGGY